MAFEHADHTSYGFIWFLVGETVGSNVLKVEIIESYGMQKAWALRGHVRAKTPKFKNPRAFLFSLSFIVMVVESLLGWMLFCRTIIMVSMSIPKFAMLSLMVASFFWLWAVFNTFTKGHFDLGAVSFLTVMLTSAYLLIQRTPSPSFLTCLLVTASHLFVSINYALGAYIGLEVLDPPRQGFGAYCIVFSVLWAFSSFVGFKLLSPTDSR